MSAHRMEGEEEGNENITQVRKLKSRICPNENNYAREDQKILEKPIAAIHRTNGEQNPPHRIASRQDGNEPMFLGLSGRGRHLLRLLRSVSATKATIRNAP